MDVLSAIGNTPLVKLRKVVPEGAAEVFVKLEYYNPTGSYKDPELTLLPSEGGKVYGGPVQALQD
jgi:cysteine synthase